MFAFKLALYKYWSLPRLGSLLNFIFSHYLHVPRYLLSFNISMKYKLYKEEKYKIAVVFYYFFWPDSSTLIQLAPGDLTHFKKLAVPDIRF